MQKKTFQEIQEEYDFEIKKIVAKIKKVKARLVLLQFPDGLKPYATIIVDELEKQTNARFLIWLGSCFGACDTPQVGNAKVDLVVQFGHSPWKSHSL